MHGREATPGTPVTVSHGLPDPALEVQRLFEDLRAAGQTLVIVTHDERVAATADRLISMRDGRLVDDT